MLLIVVVLVVCFAFTVAVAVKRASARKRLPPLVGRKLSPPMDRVPRPQEGASYEQLVEWYAVVSHPLHLEPLVEAARENRRVLVEGYLNKWHGATETEK